MKPNKILNKLIKDSFPLLKDKKFFLEYSELRNANAETRPDIKIKPSSYSIKLHPHTKKMSEKALIGLLAHELCHCEIWLRRGPVKNILWDWGCWLFWPFEKKDEAMTDMLVGEKGYKKELIEYARFKELVGQKSKIYLNSDELMKLWEEHQSLTSKSRKSKGNLGE